MVFGHHLSDKKMKGYRWYVGIKMWRRMCSLKHYFGAQRFKIWTLKILINTRKAEMRGLEEMSKRNERGKKKDFKGREK